MDIKETSAMTEASGIANDETDRALGTRPASAAENHPPLFDSRQAAERLSERLRELTVQAPLQSLFAAFLLGVWVARRR
jgi:hypothetical protein